MNHRPCCFGPIVWPMIQNCLRPVPGCTTEHAQCKDTQTAAGSIDREDLFDLCPLVRIRRVAATARLPVREAHGSAYMTAPGSEAVGRLTRRAVCPFAKVLFRRPLVATPWTTATSRAHRQRGFVHGVAAVALNECHLPPPCQSEGGMDRAFPCRGFSLWMCVAFRKPSRTGRDGWGGLPCDTCVRSW